MVQGTIPLTPDTGDVDALDEPAGGRRDVSPPLRRVFLGPTWVARVQLRGALGFGHDTTSRDPATGPWSRWFRRRCRAAGSRRRRSHPSRPAACMKLLHAAGIDVVPGVAVALQIGADDDPVGLPPGTRQRWWTCARCWRAPAPWPRAPVLDRCQSLHIGSTPCTGPEMRMASARLDHDGRTGDVVTLARTEGAGELRSDVHEHGDPVGTQYAAAP